MTTTRWAQLYNSMIALDADVAAPRWLYGVGPDVFQSIIEFTDEPVVSSELIRFTTTKLGVSTFAPTAGQGGLALVTTAAAEGNGINSQFGNVGMYVPSSSAYLYWGMRFKMSEATQNRWFVGLSDLDTSILGAYVAITSSSVANPTVITTGAAHGLTTGDVVLIAGHTGSTPAISGTYTVTVTGGSTFTIPVNVSVGGTGGTMIKKSSHMIGFRKEDGAATVEAVVANASTETTLASVMTQDADQYHTFDFLWSGPSNRCRFYVDDEETTSPMSTFGNVPRTALLLPSFAYLTGEAVAKNLTMDWIRTIQIGRS